MEKTNYMMTVDDVAQELGVSKQKGHCHNHIIFCAADNVEHKKYNDCKRTYRQIRNLSDELCREHGLSVIIPSGQNRFTHISVKNFGEGYTKEAIREKK